MFKLFTFFFSTFPLILAWLYLFAAGVFVAVSIRQIKNKTGISVGQWILMVINILYILFFAITRSFFLDFWKQTFSILGILAMLISFIWTHYEDRRNGQRWWDW